ncbi:MAG: alcohol dehydrogenase catalytic domain-containing protein [Myxococcota bacterium]
MKKTMRAFRMLKWQEPPALVEIDLPEPGPGEIRIKVAGNGVCQSDLHMPHLPAVMEQFLGWKMPFTLGHEVGGWIDKLGSGVVGHEEGQPVAIVSTRSCGHCLECDAGFDNACDWNKVGRGYGMNGGIADYLIVESDRPILKLDKLDPRRAGPLTDAGSTSFHGVRRVTDRLGPGRTAFVIGAGGLGSFAIQYLKILTTARIVVADVAPDKRARAIELGADEVIDGGLENVAGELLKRTDGRGADAVLDFVGTTATISTSIAALAKLGRYALIGAGEGKLEAPLMGALSGKGASICSFVGGTAEDTRSAIELAEQGLLRNDVEFFDIADSAKAFEKLAAGQLAGRAVIVP